MLTFRQVIVTTRNETKETGFKNLILFFLFQGRPGSPLPPFFYGDPLSSPPPPPPPAHMGTFLDKVPSGNSGKYCIVPECLTNLREHKIRCIQRQCRNSGNNFWVPKRGSDSSPYLFILFLYPHVVPSGFLELTFFSGAD